MDPFCTVFKQSTAPYSSGVAPRFAGELSEAREHLPEICQAWREAYHREELKQYGRQVRGSL